MATLTRSDVDRIIDTMNTALLRSTGKAGKFWSDTFWADLKDFRDYAGATDFYDLANIVLVDRATTLRLIENYLTALENRGIADLTLAGRKGAAMGFINMAHMLGVIDWDIRRAGKMIRPIRG